MTTTHVGQGIAIPEGQPYEIPDRADITRRAAQREVQERKARMASLAETEESERRTVAEQHGIGAAMRSYHEQGGRAAIQWVVTAVPIEDEPDPFNGLPGNGYARGKA
jgi:hypothetical protein